jgi:hypothetical protein
MKQYVAVGLTVLAGAALVETALIPGILIGGAAVLVPRLSRYVRLPGAKSTIRLRATTRFSSAASRASISIMQRSTFIAISRNSISVTQTALRLASTTSDVSSTSQSLI